VNFESILKKEYHCSFVIKEHLRQHAVVSMKNTMEHNLPQGIIVDTFIAPEEFNRFEGYSFVSGDDSLLGKTP